MRKFTTCSTAAILALTGIVSAQPDHEHAADHSQHQPSAADSELKLNLDDGERWATDESLRSGMAGIHAAFEASHTEFEHDAFGPGEASALADTIEEQVNFMVANCRLPPAADAELHKLLAAALAAADTLRNSNDPHAGLHKLHQVLDAYSAHFDHPDWDMMK